MDEHAETPKRIDTNDPTNGRYAVTEFPAYEYTHAFRHKTTHKPNWAWRVSAAYNRVVQSRCITLPDHTKPVGHTKDFAVIFLRSPGELARARNLGWSVDVTDDARAAQAGELPPAPEEAPEPEAVEPPATKPAPKPVEVEPPLTAEDVEAMGFAKLRRTLLDRNLSGAGNTAKLRGRLLESLEA